MSDGDFHHRYAEDVCPPNNRIHSHRHVPVWFSVVPTKLIGSLNSTIATILVWPPIKSWGCNGRIAKGARISAAKPRLEAIRMHFMCAF
mmetsp:Transcript_15952/g.43932  ORF Transcript_15952/g.43932 Transcript_15952/m.43932 type:complete len:89 (-) Transcript_15952:1012-1278(-)